MLLYHIFRTRTVIYCVWNHTSLKTCTWCLLSGLGTRLKGPFPQSWVERRAFSVHVWCLLGLAVAAEGVQPANPASPAVARELMQLEVKGSLHLQSAMGCRSWRMVNLSLLFPCCREVGSSPFSRHTMNAVGVQSPQGSTKGSHQSLHWVQDTNVPLTVSHHCLPGQMSVSSLLQWLGVPASCEPLAFWLLLIPLLLCSPGLEGFSHRRI